MRIYTLEEQVEGLKGFITSDPHQFALKNSILETLGRLQSLRNRIQRNEKVDSDKFANDLAAALGQPPRHGRS